MNRKPRAEIVRLSQTTWFGTIAITLATALRELSLDGKLELLDDLMGHIRRIDSELRRHAMKES